MGLWNEKDTPKTRGAHDTVHPSARRHDHRSEHHRAGQGSTFTVTLPRIVTPETVRNLPPVK